MTSFWIAAERALQHLQANQSQIEATFATYGIKKSDYVLYAGFDESVIHAEVGYLEQIHVFSSASIIATSLLSQLGKIFSPFSSILFTESSVYELPIYKPDGTTWIFDELVFQTASKLVDRGSTAAIPTVISMSKTAGESNPSGGQPSNKTGSNNQEKKRKDKKGKGKEDDEMGSSDRDNEEDDDNSGKDSDDPDDKPENSIDPPMVLFDVVSEMIANQNGTEERFQVLGVQGQIMIQVCD